jgi:hypothetical protein
MTSFPPPRIRLISFGAGRPGINRALNRLRKQAEETSWFDEIRLHGPESLQADYWESFDPSVTNNPKGFGLWSWKPYLIQRELRELSEGDVLIYVDAGVEVNKNGRGRFISYLDHVSRLDILLFSMEIEQRAWSKNAVVDLGGVRHFFRKQVVASVVVLRKSERSLELVAKWKKICETGKGSLLRDPEEVEFGFAGGAPTHRHDQSLLSLVAYELEIETLPDETFFMHRREARRAPFLALRNSKGGRSFLWPSLYLPTFLARIWRLVSLAFDAEVIGAKVSSFTRLKSR